MKPPFMGNSSIPPYLKYMSAGMLGVLWLACLAYAGYISIWHGTDAIPGVVYFVIGTGASISLQIIGAHSGVSLAETPTPATPAAPAPTPDAPVVVPAPPASGV